jgi:glyoxylase-like metal-dependent hydrolase (beta-lactamase superfamily II)
MKERRNGESMVEEIAPHLYRIPIPLPGTLLGWVNAYVLKGRERNLIIDTGMDLDPCMQAMEEGLRRIDVDPAESDFFITHAHPDHCALVFRLVREGSVIYIERREAEVIESVRSGAMFADFQNFVRLTGFPDSDLREILPPEVTQRSKIEQVWPFRFVKDGDALSVGDYRFRCVTTPGHSSGHTCLYESEKGLLLAGDHLLCDITPGIQARSDTGDPLSDYLQSLDNIYPLDVGLVLPGHRDFFTGFRERIDELKEHHRARASEITAELENGGKSVYEVASGITWNVVDSDSWGSVPDLQKLLATGEAFAHLKYLEGKSALRRELREGRIIFSLA